MSSAPSPQSPRDDTRARGPVPCGATARPVAGSARTSPGGAGPVSHSEPDIEIAPLVAGFYEEAPPAVRENLLRVMLRQVGPLALVALAAGAFSRLLPPRPAEPLELTSDISRHIQAQQVVELARYVQQKSPESLLRLPDLVGTPQVWMATVSGALLLVALGRLRRTGR